MKDFGIKVKFLYDLEDFIEKIDYFSEENNYGYSLEENNGSILLNFEILPHFPLEFKIDEEISFEIKSCYYGAGFHVLVINLLNELSTFLNTKLEIFDETGFIKDEDFEKLKATFNNWLEDRAKMILENKNNMRIRSSLLFNSDVYPVFEDDYVLSYMGVIPINEFENLYKEGIETLSKRCFLFSDSVSDIFNEENYLLYHIWNNLKDLTMVDDFDERMSLTMFMFDNLINNDVKIHLPQKYAREIYKYLGVDSFSASNFVYRKVRYEIGYQYYDKLISKFNFNLIIPSFFEYSRKLNSFISSDNAISINEYKNKEKINLSDYKIETILNDRFVITEEEIKNEGKMFTGYDMSDEEYGYVSTQVFENKCEENSFEIIDLDNYIIYEINILGLDSKKIAKHIVKSV